MRDLGLEGARRGKTIRTTIRDDGQERAGDLLGRDFTAARPNQRWVADFTCVADLVGDRLRRIRRGRVLLGARGLVGGHQQAGQARPGCPRHGPVAPRPRRNSRWTGAGSSFGRGPDTSFAFTAHLVDAGIDASIGTIGDALDNALMESQIGLYKTELNKPRKPWRGLADVELATAEWDDSFNNQRLHPAIKDIPPHEHDYYAQHQPQPVAGANA